MSPVGITIRLRVIYDKQRNRLWAIMHVEGPSPQEVTSPQDHLDRITPLIFAASDPLGLKPTWFGIETLEFQPVGDFDLVTPALGQQLNMNLAAQLAWAGFSVNLRDNPSLSVHPRAA